MDEMPHAETLVARLRDYEVGYRPHVVGAILAQAADEVERLNARVDQLETILKYFNCIDFDHFTEHDELLLEDTRRDAIQAFRAGRGGEKSVGFNGVEVSGKDSS